MTHRYLALLLPALLALPALSGCPGNPTLLPIMAVIMSNSDGTGQCPISLAEIDTWVTAANETYTKHGHQFTFDHADVIHVKDTTLNQVPYVPDGWTADPAHGIYWSDQEWYDMFANSIAAAYPDRIVIFFRNEGGKGWSWGPPQTRYISMPAYTHTAINKPAPNSPNDTLLAHEAGHFLGLAHTFAGVACDKVTLGNADGDAGGQDDYTTADDITDTPADPGADCAPTASLNCAGGSVTVNGVVFNPPWTNIMTYHDCLPETITLDQRKAIVLTLQDPLRAGIPQ